MKMVLKKGKVKKKKKSNMQVAFTKNEVSPGVLI